MNDCLQVMNDYIVQCAHQIAVLERCKYNQNAKGKEPEDVPGGAVLEDDGEFTVESRGGGEEEGMRN